jgi:tol-pal system protein YbgF
MQGIDQLLTSVRLRRQAKFAWLLPLAFVFLAGPARAEMIRLEQSHGVFVLSAQINGTFSLPFILDSGAGEVVIPADAWAKLLSSNSVKESDYVGSGFSILADGSRVPAKRYMLREVRVGHHVIRDVVASITSAQAMPLLGQSFLSRLPNWTIDNHEHALVLADPPKPTSAAAPAASDTPGRSLAVLPESSVTVQYNYAYDLFKDGNYGAAEAAFKAFIEQHPDDLLAANAQYWLAGTYFARSQFKEAALAYADGYQRFPRAPKASDGLLRLGISLARSGDTHEACEAFDRLEHDFPNQRGPAAGRVTAEKIRIGC